MFRLLRLCSVYYTSWLGFAYAEVLAKELFLFNAEGRKNLKLSQCKIAQYFDTQTLPRLLHPRLSHPPPPPLTSPASSSPTSLTPTSVTPASYSPAHTACNLVCVMGEEGGEGVATPGGFRLETFTRFSS